MGFLKDVFNQDENAINALTMPNARGFVPFHFSSRKLQQDLTSLGGLLMNPVTNLINSTMSWYEMFINPEKVAIKQSIMTKKQHTARSVVTYHYRPDTYVMSISGVCGWIINPEYPYKNEKEQTPFGFRGNDPRASYEKGTLRNYLDKNSFQTNPAQNNSPRVFLTRLRKMAEEPMYYVDLDGIEHYNTKFIKIFTKQYPDGMICEGYYTNFNVPEGGEDVQTINYDFEFIIERMIPVSELTKITGMFGSKGSSV